MTAIAQRKTRLRFETSGTVRGRGVIIEADAYLARVRLKGMRTAYEISWEGIYWQAAKVAAEKRRAERKTRREVTHRQGRAK